MTVAEDLRAAERFDAEGNHDEAINALARATKAGSVEAMTQLGKRLLVGDRGPCLPQHGASFIHDAARAGGAEAAARLAVLVAAGIQVKQSWNDAFNILIAAAERGWIPARQEVCALAGDRPLAEEALQSENPPADIWGRLVRSVDFDFWMSVTNGETLNDDPLVRRFSGFLPGPVCDWMRERSSGRLERAKVYDGLARRDTVHQTRTNKVASFDLADTDIVQLLVQLRMSLACGLPMANMEATAVLHYDVGEEITNHFDFVDPKTPNYEEEIRTHGQRVVTFLVYLNDDYEGGETEFPKLGLKHKGEAGEGLFFVNALKDGAADLRTVHAGRPPKAGEKWIISQFIRNRTARPFG